MLTSFLEVPYTSPDPVFELKATFDKDPSCNKINLGPGAYLDDQGKPWILPSVALAEQAMRLTHPGHEYLPILGLPSFRSAAARVLFGHGSSLLEGFQVASIQSTSGTGAIRLAAQFLRLFIDPYAAVYVSDPTWSNHRIMLEYSGFHVKTYPYYDQAVRGINWQSFRDTLRAAPPGSVFVLHPCAHNPTGYDLTQAQWKELGQIMKERKLLPLLDSAYQGFASGDLDRDGWAIRYLTEELGLTAIACQSFSKSMGSYCFSDRNVLLYRLIPGTGRDVEREAHLHVIERASLDVWAQYR